MSRGVHAYTRGGLACLAATHTSGVDDITHDSSTHGLMMVSSSWEEEAANSKGGSLQTASDQASPCIASRCYPGA